MNSKHILRQLAVIVSLVFTLVSNALASILPINGITTEEISDSFPVFFTPAGYVFAIWGVIYLGLIVLTVVHSLPARRDDPAFIAIGPWLVAANLFNGIWIYFWHYLIIPVSMILIIGLLVSLIMIYLKLGIGRGGLTGSDRWTVGLPISIYLGWASVATVANAAVMLYDLGWRGAPLSEPLWAAVVIVVALGLGLAMIWDRREIAYPAVLIWAFIGIYMQQSPRSMVVGWVALAGAAVLAVVIIVRQVVPGTTATA